MNIKLIAVIVFTLVGVLASIQCSSDYFEVDKKKKKKTKKVIDPSQYEALGINTEHLFIFSDNSMTYNGKSAMVGQKLEDFVALLGPYDRSPSRTIYIWDEIGVLLTTPLWNNKHYPDIDRVNNIHIFWNLDMSGEQYETDDEEMLRIRKKMVERCPKKFFRGKIIVDGVPLGRDTDIGGFVAEANGKWKIQYGSYRLRLYDFDYKKAPLDENRLYMYGIMASGAKIEKFNAGHVNWK